MESIERDLNAYLFLAFGMEGEEDSISEAWPFSLRRLGEIGVRVIFEFDDADEPYFAISGPCLDFLPKKGMTMDDLTLQFIGSEWIAAQDPVSLAESRPGDDSISSGIERQRALEKLGKHATGNARAEILEGLFLRHSHQYLGLFRVLNELGAVVVGLDTPIRVGHDRCSSWRRLAWGVGQWIKSQHQDVTSQSQS
ncbi:MAG TPA: hypothetical protein VFI24_04515 [Pyrinomonadaceae bacterium]|nr:hypothetical protein [Pyrinomonadaceae bacterium]